MAIDITYKGDSLASFGSGTKTMKTAGKYMEDDVTITVPSGSATTPATTVTANPTISVSSGGLITATASATKSVTPSVSAGWVASGTAGTITVSGSNTSQLSTQAAKTVTPTTSEQTAVASGKYTTGAIKVAAIPSNYKDTTNADAVAADVLDGKVFVNGTGEVTGTMPNNGAISIDLYPLESSSSCTIPEGYHDGTGEVFIPLRELPLYVTPSDESQTIPTTVEGSQAGTMEVLESVVVEAIPAKYGDTTGDNAVAANLLSGVKAHTNSNGASVQITGTMANNGAVSKTLDATSNNQSYTVPAGFHNGSGTVGIVLETKSATPSTSSQNITPTSGKVLSKVTVNAIPAKYGDTTGDDAVAANLLSGKKAHTISSGTATQITGTMTNNGAVSKTLDATSNNQSYTVPAGYHNGSGTVNIVLETKTWTPSTSAQNITPTTGKVLSKVTVNAIPAKYGDTTGDDAVAANILGGKKAHTIVNGVATQITGTMIGWGTVTGEIDGLSSTSVTLPQGFYTSITVSLTSDIENALAAI